MARFTNELDNKNLLIKGQWIFIGVLTLFGLYAMHGWSKAPTDLTVHVPPDLRTGASLKPGEVPPPNVYAFAYYIWQQVNRWPENGDKDYGMAIFKTQAYVTPQCRAQLEEDMNRKKNDGELSMRTRTLVEMPGHTYDDSRVVPISSQAWKVTLDAEISETVRGLRVKDTLIRYPLRVVRFDVDRQSNPFGLAIDCYGDSDQPTRLEPDADQNAAAKPSSPAGGAAGQLQNALAH